MIAAIYARKSTDQSSVSDEQKSVARQVERAHAYAAAKGWAIAEEHVYVDDGISGAEFAERPSFLRLMNALKPRAPFDALIMSEESRLGREQIEVSYALKLLVTSGCRVFCYLTDTERTLNSPIEKAMLALQTMSDEMERERGRQRTYDAMSRKARLSHVTGGSVFGYVNIDVTDDAGRRSHVERQVEPRQAAVVREIFERCARGQGKVAIAKALNEAGAHAPRAQRGRPRAWAPSSVREVLYRDLYRGEIVWNKTRKRDAWGKVAAKARPESDWLRVPAPQLRIVSDALWQEAHARLELSRQTYLRSTNGQLWGRPPSGIASKYLLTGLARCGVCGGGLEARSRSHGRQRAYYYSCSSYYRRGASVCPNRYEIPMLRADRAVLNAFLEEILTPERLVDVVRRVVEHGRGVPDQVAAERDDVARRLEDTRTALGRLTAAVASGGDLPSLVDALRHQEQQRKALERRLAALDRPVATFDGIQRRKVEAHVDRWREVLTKRVPQARQIVTKLLSDRLTFTPEGRDGRDGFRFEATGTIAKLVAGSLPSLSTLQAVASPPGIEPGSRP